MGLLNFFTYARETEIHGVRIKSIKPANVDQNRGHCPYTLETGSRLKLNV